MEVASGKKLFMSAVLIMLSGVSRILGVIDIGKRWELTIRGILPDQ